MELSLRVFHYSRAHFKLGENKAGYKDARSATQCAGYMRLYGYIVGLLSGETAWNCISEMIMGEYQLDDGRGAIKDTQKGEKKKRLVRH